MVEGHGVHRVAIAHAKRLLGKKFAATSPNGRFAAGAAAIHKKVLSRIEAVGKNLFYFFGKGHASTVVVRIHFGMSGRFATFKPSNVPEAKPTTRLELSNNDVVAHLSAMTVEHGGVDHYDTWRSKLGEDPLRKDADIERLWQACGAPGTRGGKASIGSVLMDQKRVAGVGNIYRAEILFKARVHPEQPANTVGREAFDRIWFHCCDLMRRGVEVGSILTLDPKHQSLDPTRRRYIYNQKRCLLCKSKIKSWTMKGRTVYACPSCQPLQDTTAIDAARKDVIAAANDVKVFKSRCAPEASDEKKLKGGKRTRKSPSKSGGKDSGSSTVRRPARRSCRGGKRANRSSGAPRTMRSEAAAALEKLRAGEGRNVEHVALEDEESRAAIERFGREKKGKKARSSGSRTSSRLKRRRKL